MELWNHDVLPVNWYLCSYGELFLCTDSLTWTWMVSEVSPIWAASPFCHDPSDTVFGKQNILDRASGMLNEMKWSNGPVLEMFGHFVPSGATRRQLTLNLTSSSRRQVPTNSAGKLSWRCMAVAFPGQGTVPFFVSGTTWLLPSCGSFC
jgi:hypothetical protein